MRDILTPVVSPVHEILVSSLTFFWKFLAAIVIFVVGWFVARFIKFLIERILRVLRLDSLAEQFKVADFLAKGGIKLTLSEIIGLIFYWVIMLGVVASALKIVDLTGVSDLLAEILGKVPVVILALIILVGGIFISAFVASIVRTATANMGISNANLLSKITQVAIIVFTILIALEKLETGQILTDTMKIALGMVGLAAALAFGLGCREIAAKFTAEVIEKLKKK
jgi:hypothetical protein